MPMDARTINFLIFGAFSLASLGAGYIARRSRWVDEEVSRPMHFHTVAWLWSTVSVLSLWMGPLGREDLWLVGMQILIVAAAGFGAIPLAKACGCQGEEVGILAVASGLGNMGFTLGAYVCYCLLEPAEAALGIAIAYVTVMQIASVLLMFPVARYYGRGTDSALPLWKLMCVNLLDVRSLSLYAAGIGQVLGALEVPVPDMIRRWHVVDILFYVGAFFSYFGIGLRLRLGQSLALLKHHAILAGMKFLFIPVLTLAMVLGIQQSGRGLSDVARQVVLIQAFMPTAIQTVILANLFHMDSRKASVIWLWNTIFFFVGPLPLILWLWGR